MTASPTATTAPVTPGVIESLEVAPVREATVRSQPTPDAEILAVVNPGQRLVATGRDAGADWVWVRVVATGRQGWASARDLNEPHEVLMGLPERAS
ncbi:MAG: SH3 domain-containing protein [Anaerolineae bacterium]|nr:SH3 domain-containing protein [Anaerolineae bacterium]